MRPGHICHILTPIITTLPGQHLVTVVTVSWVLLPPWADTRADLVMARVPSELWSLPMEPLPQSAPHHKTVFQFLMVLMDVKESFPSFQPLEPLPMDMFQNSEMNHLSQMDIWCSRKQIVQLISNQKNRKHESFLAAKRNIVTETSPPFTLTIDTIIDLSKK